MMKIRTKLFLLIVILGAPLFFNLLVLGYLVRTVTQSVQTIQEVAVRQQAVTLRMQAQLRDAEAALYRYQIEGAAGYAQQFADLLNDFAQEITAFESLATSDQEQIWATEMAQAHQEATVLGDELIKLRDAQTTNLRQLEDLYSKTSVLLTKIRLARPSNNAAYQTAVNGMQTDLREMLLAVTAHLAAPHPAEQIRFEDAALSFHFHYEQFDTLLTSFQERRWSAELRRNFARLNVLGLGLIKGRDRQQQKFTQFAANLAQVGHQVIVNQIQPHAAANLAEAQTRLTSTLAFAITWSIITSLAAVIIALILTIPNLRQITAGIQTLLAGADRVAAGDLSRPVRITSNDELYQLGQTFNTMMEDLAARESRLQRRISELETLREVSLQLTSVLDLEHVLHTIAGNTRKLIDAAEVHIFLYDEANDIIQLRASDRRSPSHPPKPHAPPKDGLVAAVVQTKAARVINQAMQHLGYTANPQTAGIRAEAAFPLILAGRLLGVFNIVLDDRDNFREGELRILSLIADQAAVALENTRLYQSVADKETQLNNLLQKLALVQEEERRLVGLDLHDSLTQILLSANLHINTLSLLATQLEGQAQAELKMGQKRLQEAIEEANRVISELRPTELEDFGLVDGLRHYVTKVAQQEGWAISFSANPDYFEVPPDFETAVFRIVQEALSNSRKYAQTDRVRVALHVEEQALIAEVQDWGRGFKVNQPAEERDSLGLLGMQERAEMLGGALFIESSPGQGTIIRAAIPLRENGAKDEANVRKNNKSYDRRRPSNGADGPA